MFDIRKKFDWRALSIMLIAGFPIMLFTEVAFGRNIQPWWIVWIAWLTILLVVSFLAKKFNL